MSENNLKTNLTQETDLSDLTLLGQKTTQPSKNLETFPNRHPDRDYTITLATDEFTCVCPATGQPDFAKITIRYIPDQRIVESKSLKLYLWSYRNEGVFHEHVTNVILDDLAAALDPRWCQVVAEFSVRGGIAITVQAEHTKS
jgi:7-cyano-7-deazaguanine reductase